MGNVPTQRNILYIILDSSSFQVQIFSYPNHLPIPTWQHHMNIYYLFVSVVKDHDDVYI